MVETGHNPFIESFLFETILIEIEELLNPVEFVDDNVSFPLDDDEVASLLRLIYATKTLKHYNKDPKIDGSINLIEHVISQFNDSEGFKSRRIQEISIIFSRNSSPQRITNRDILEWTETNPHLKKLVTQIKDDLINYRDKDNKKFVNAFYGLALVLRKAPHRSPNLMLWESLSQNVERSFKENCKRLLNERKNISKIILSFFLNIITLKDKPVFFALLLAGGSFLAGQVFDRNYVSVEHAYKGSVSSDSLIQFLRRRSPKQVKVFEECNNFLAAKEKKVPRKWHINEYEIYTASIQEEKGLMKFNVTLGNSNEPGYSFATYDQLVLIRERLKKETFNMKREMAEGDENKQCWEVHKLELNGIPNHTKAKMFHFSTERHNPMIDVEIADKNTQFTLKKGFSFTVWIIRLYVKKIHVLFTIMGILILIFLIFYVYANRNTIK